MSRIIVIALGLALGGALAGAGGGAGTAEAAYSDAMTLFDTAALERADRPDLAANPVHGKTVRWTWKEGPAKGSVFEHVFQEDGTVLWRVLKGPHKGFSKLEKGYAAERLGGDLYTISYRAASGHMMTIVLNLKDGTMVGLASGAQDWYPVRGTFAIVK
jgi:hypothetical protein